MGKSESYHALALFRYSLRAFLRQSDEILSAEGIETQQYQLLLAIKFLSAEGENCSIRDLSEHLLIRHHSAVELIDRAERNRLVVRQRDPQDGRRAIVALTSRSDRLLAKLVSRHAAVLRREAPQLQRALKELMAGRRNAASKARRL